jgi:DNA-binding transcriptional regulator LsrR (DeoR family)
MKQYYLGIYNTQITTNMEPRKLSYHQAQKIREYYFDKGATQKQLANMYGVSQGIIKGIVQGKTYKREYVFNKNQ